MTMTDPKAHTGPRLPPGWSLDVTRGRLNIGWTVTGTYGPAGVPDHVTAEASAFLTAVEYGRPIVRRWSLLRRRTIRWAQVAIWDVEDTPRNEWLDDRFAAGKPDEVLFNFGNGVPIAVRYFPGGPGETVMDVTGYLRIEDWTSIGMSYRAYSIDHDLPGQDTTSTHLSEFGIVWDARTV